MILRLPEPQLQLQIERLLDKSYLEEALREVKRQKHSMIEQDNAYEEEAEVLARALAQQSKDFSSRRKKNLDISVYVEREQKKEDDKKKKKSDEDALVEMQSVEEREAAVQEEEEKEFRKLYPLLVDGVGRVLFSAVKSVRQGFHSKAEFILDLLLACSFPTVPHSSSASSSTTLLAHSLVTALFNLVMEHGVKSTLATPWSCILKVHP